MIELNTVYKLANLGFIISIFPVFVVIYKLLSILINQKEPSEVFSDAVNDLIISELINYNSYYLDIDDKIEEIESNNYYVDKDDLPSKYKTLSKDTKEKLGFILKLDYKSKYLKCKLKHERIIRCYGIFLVIIVYAHVLNKVFVIDGKKIINDATSLIITISLIILYGILKCIKSKKNYKIKNGIFNVEDFISKLSKKE